MFDWQWGYTLEIMPRLLQATLNTLKAAGLGYGIAVLLGLPLALLQRTHSRGLTLAVRELMEFVRSTPLVLQIFFVFYVGPQFGLRLSPWTSGMIAIGLHYATYLSEVFRSGLEAVPRGQWEACKALNLGTARTYGRIVIPQAVPVCLPGMGNYLVGILKDTPMLSVIGVAELMHTANALGSETYRFLEPYTLVGIIFLALSLPAAAGFRFLETRVRRRLNMDR
jgi:polar amino acid transport system permease protein